ncbi:transcriptional regulator [Paenibacillus yonginensis]|uniref:Transcriptional regulator n=1 Tax=Paenibacillus yonginensis TaxID=1462996 RepID=A0A1B1N7I6_9BACL|nr:LCP family protein [Paenibacillus yonginensis]ANS77392.1 transcriptional regulator [Paenibacillus yonginensis]
MTKRTKRITLWSVIGVLVVVLAFAAYYFFAIYRQIDDFSKEGEDSPFYQVQPSHTKAEEPPKWEGTERVNILLMGVDARGLQKGEVPRSDSMLVASIDPVSKQGSLFSIMRDTYVDIPDHGRERINTAITHGPDVAMKTVSDLLGIPIQYYVYTDFQGFIALVDAVGGIDFDVEKDMHYTSAADDHQYDIDLKKGMQHLDGKTALEYVRFRHDALSDFARTERQRNFLAAVADKLKSTTSIMNLPTILNKVNPYVDTNLSVTDMWKLATVGYKTEMNASEQIPPMELLKEENVGGASVIGIKDEEALKQYVQDSLNKTAEEPSSSPDADESTDGGSVNAAGTSGSENAEASPTPSP